MGAEKFPRKILFKVANNDGLLKEQYTYEQTNGWANRVANGLSSKFEIKKGDRSPDNLNKINTATPSRKYFLE